MTITKPFNYYFISFILFKIYFFENDSLKIIYEKNIHLCMVWSEKSLSGRIAFPLSNIRSPCLNFCFCSWNSFDGLWNLVRGTTKWLDQRYKWCFAFNETNISFRYNHFYLWNITPYLRTFKHIWTDDLCGRNWK